MKRALTITAVLLTCVLPAAAAEHGPAYPSDSNRGPAFPSSAAPSDSNFINWVAPHDQYTDPDGPNARRNHWGRRYWRG
jgi:hypothetical protein